MLTSKNVKNIFNFIFLKIEIKIIFRERENSVHDMMCVCVCHTTDLLGTSYLYSYYDYVETRWSVYG